jgi:hypothetical protein
MNLNDFGNDYESAAKYFEVSTRTIRRWKQKEGTYQPKPGYGPNKLSKDQVKKIKSLGDSYNQTQLAKMFGVTQAMIGRILNNVSHKSDFMITGSGIYSFHSSSEEVTSFKKKTTN